MKVKVGDETFEAVGILTLENKNAVLLSKDWGAAPAAYIPFWPEYRELITKANADGDVLGFVRPDGHIKYMLPDESCLTRPEEIGMLVQAHGH